MVFSSITFLFLFLPVTLATYFLLPEGRAARNGFLLIASLFFYAWGELGYVAVMLASIALNYAAAILIEDTRGQPSYRAVVWWGIAGNLGLLCCFKYTNFLARNLTQLFTLLWQTLGWADAPVLDPGPIHLPLGISFFTFHAISYLIDVHRRKVTAQRRLLDLALYISLFPQLVAGPVVRYRDVASQIIEPRRVGLDDLAEGTRRFIIGLGKKVLLANPLGQTANAIFALDHHTMLNAPACWLGVACYTFQIYYDFSGYSDMAIGLGRLFGFRFLENFDYPYVSRSLGEFWRRWHISLSTWFRDYLYIPLGGNRHGSARTLFNLLTVFFFCGLWHGASWTFVVWGLWHGAFLIAERSGLAGLLTRLPAVVSQGYTLLVVALGWVFFRENTFADALLYLRALAGGAPAIPAIQEAAHTAAAMHLEPGRLLVLAAATVGCAPWLEAWQHWRTRQTLGKTVLAARWQEGVLAGAGAATLLAVFFFCVLSLITSAYNPFIYFRF